MKLSIVLVHYLTPELAGPAVASIRRDLARAESSGLEAEILIVDNGSDPAGRAALAALPATLLEPGTNLGFAGGVALGARAATGDALVVANVDLEVLPGCLSALAAALAGGAAAAGPRFVWDSAGRLLLPPAERRDRMSELLAALATRGAGWSALARRRWRDHARRHWRAETAIPSHDLSGALLAVSRAAWERIGPFDAGFPLYFEETDWLMRLRRAGGTAVYEPRARVLHRYGRSAAREPRTAAWFEQSRRRFAVRWYGERFERLIRRLAGGSQEAVQWPAREAGSGRPEVDLAAVAAADRGPLWIELSPLARGFPAATERLPRGSHRWELPEEVWRGMHPGRWRWTVVDDHGREHAAASFERPAEGG